MTSTQNRNWYAAPTPGHAPGRHKMSRKRVEPVYDWFVVDAPGGRVYCTLRSEAAAITAADSRAVHYGKPFHVETDQGALIYTTS